MKSHRSGVHFQTNVISGLSNSGEGNRNFISIWKHWMWYYNKTTTTHQTDHVIIFQDVTRKQLNQVYSLPCHKWSTLLIDSLHAWVMPALRTVLVKLQWNKRVQNTVLGRHIECESTSGVSGTYWSLYIDPHSKSTNDDKCYPTMVSAANI